MFALPAYLARIDLPALPTIDADGLQRLQRQHRLTIPFENLDIRLGRGIAIDSASVFDKLVTRRRGGYCFEHNRLFLDALDALGFVARPLLARVWLAVGDAVPPLTHTLALVTIEGQPWIADPGFGGSYFPILPLTDGAEATAPDGARFVLRADPEHGWMLLRDGAAGGTDGRNTAPGWQPQFSFDLRTVEDADLLLANHWTSTAPNTRFTTLTIASIVLPHGFARLTDRHYARSAAGDEASGEITDPRVYRMRMSLMFGIDLSADEVAQLGLF